MKSLLILILLFGLLHAIALRQKSVLEGDGNVEIDDGSEDDPPKKKDEEEEVSVSAN